MQTVYVETTIPSYYFETRSAPKIVAWRDITRRWWDSFRSDFDLVTSRFVLDELAGAREPKASRAIELLDGIPLLETDRRVLETAKAYLTNKLLPRDASADSIHLALASVWRVEFLLTWNCKHLANANKAIHLGALNRRLGLHVPKVITPLTLLPEGKR